MMKERPNTRTSDLASIHARKIGLGPEFSWFAANLGFFSFEIALREMRRAQ